MSRIKYKQKIQKRRKRSRSRIDLMEVHRNVAATRRQRSLLKHARVKGALLALMAILGFFLVGYVVAGLSMSIWTKVLLFAFISMLGFILSQFLVVFFH